MVEVLTAQRLRLVQKVRTKSSSITALAAALKRHPKSVRRDVLKLERAGVVRTREQINPGHGRVKIVEPVAREYRSPRSFKPGSASPNGCDRRFVPRAQGACC